MTSIAPSWLACSAMISAPRISFQGSHEGSYEGSKTTVILRSQIERPFRKLFGIIRRSIKLSHAAIANSDRSESAIDRYGQAMKLVSAAGFCVLVQPRRDSLHAALESEGTDD
ncbi:hypothetical protein [Bradyrhizobium manausense]|uniref:hypothetical protein n=1 Tax=Bradyrhizobium manausense TaxID=989370 RepID=UPI000B2D98B0|nr:hypothetical protein [Bradyrhizobium manausense]